MTKTGLKSIAIPDKLYDRLKQTAHPGQSFAGIIEELLAENEAMKISGYRNDTAALVTKPQ